MHYQELMEDLCQVPTLEFEDCVEGARVHLWTMPLSMMCLTLCAFTLTFYYASLSSASVRSNNPERQESHEDVELQFHDD